MAQKGMSNRYQLLVIGGSAGSLDVVLPLLAQLRTDLGMAVVIVLHRKGGLSMLEGLLNDKTAWSVKEAEEKEALQQGTVYLAPADYHLMIEKEGTLSLDYSEKVHYSRPSIDVTFETAAEAFGPAVVGLLLSGASADGTKGLQLIKEKGGLTLVQNPADAAVSYMPQHATENMTVDHLLNAVDMAVFINKLNR